MDTHLGGSEGQTAAESVQAAAQRAHRLTSRTFENAQAILAKWLESRNPEFSSVEVELSEGSTANGMSNESLLFSASWTTEGTRVEGRFVARIAPDPGDFPIFHSYDLHRQFRVMSLVSELSEVAVPEPLWFESDSSILGSPFFVMRFVSGHIPPDVPPYNGESWLSRSSVQNQRDLQRRTIDVLAQLHAIPDADHRFAFLHSTQARGSALRRHVSNTLAWYEFAREDGARSELVERGFRWLEDNWPLEEKSAVLNWGDARIGNIIYADFHPVAVLDWEMASVAPREIDLTWMVYSHRVFEDLVSTAGMAGMPRFLDLPDVVTAYEEATGYSARSLDFYLMYAALRWAIVFLRTGTRRARFGGHAMPDNANALLLNRSTLETMLRR